MVSLCTASGNLVLWYQLLITSTHDSWRSRKSGLSLKYCESIVFIPLFIYSHTWINYWLNSSTFLDASFRIGSGTVLPDPELNWDIFMTAVQVCSEVDSMVWDQSQLLSANMPTVCKLLTSIDKSWSCPFLFIILQGLLHNWATDSPLDQCCGSMDPYARSGQIGGREERGLCN